jgi:DNA transposition AAA+ family ATPase
MLPQFAKTSNVMRFTAGITKLEQRGASEASWLLATGEPGLGKTKTIQWYATQQGGIYLRAKSNWTPRWLLAEIVSELGFSSGNSLQALFNQALGALAQSPCPIVIDEARNMLHDGRLLETLRDLSDLTEVPIILGGEDFVLGRLASRYPQIASRISEVVKFEAASIADVRICVDTLCEVKVADDLVAEIHKQSLGYLREIKNAVAACEAFGKRLGGRELTLADIGGQKLCRDRRQAKSGGSAR